MESLPTSLRLVVIGLNHKTAPLAVREALAFNAYQLPVALAWLKTRFPSAEFVILSTCNRVEIYLARPLRQGPSTEELIAFLAEFHQLKPADFADHLYHHEDRAMVEHLFEVAGSLDSMVVGETQILAQVKQAYLTACAHQTCQAMFHALFQRALAAAKAVHDQTSLANGRVSVASVAVDLVRTTFDRFDDKTVLCIGAGAASRLVLRHLAELTPRRLLVTSRDPAKAAALAAEYSAAAVAFDLLPELLSEADIIVTGTGSAHPLITAALLEPRQARRPGSPADQPPARPRVIVDIAVPRDVEPAAGALPGVHLYNMDDLQRRSLALQDQRRGSVAASQALLAEHVEAFLAWNAARDVGPIVQALYAWAQEHAQNELAEYRTRHPELTAQQQDDLERMLHRVVGKLLHTPVTQLTHQAQTSARPMLASALKRLFQLDPQRPDSESPLDSASL